MAQKLINRSARRAARWVAGCVAGGTVLAMMIAGCESGPPALPAELNLVKAEGVARVDPPADAPVAEVVAGIARFGHAVMPADPSSNWVASPASIAWAVAMLRAGAAGPTAAEIDEVFGFPARVHEGFNAVSRQVVTVDGPPPPKPAATREPGAPPAPSVVSVANALFPSVDIPIRDTYLRTLAEQYGAGVYPLDFRQPQAALAAIDGWAQHMTAGRIKKVLDQLDPDTAAVLANTVYFRGEWQSAFNADQTEDMPFTRSDGSAVSAPMMRGIMHIGYAEGSGWQAIELPYGPDGQYVMRVLLPAGDLTPRDLLEPSVLASAQFAAKAVDVQLPRWDFAADMDLKEELIRLGMTSAFDPDRADLSGISEETLYVSDAIHRANITVDEHGSEAAAVTALVMRVTAAAPVDVTFHADHPFAFAIVHVATGAPLFIGQVADPTAH